MKSIIALWAMTILSLFAIWNCIATRNSMVKATKKKDVLRLKKDLQNSIYGTIVVVAATVVAWVL
jgi:hypothetical protein